LAEIHFGPITNPLSFDWPKPSGCTKLSLFVNHRSKRQLALGANAMVGLSASQLQAETLFPGDTVEYFSMVRSHPPIPDCQLSAWGSRFRYDHFHQAFVAGDPRGHRVAKVLRVDRLDDEFPIRVDTQEMLPLTLMLKRKKDRNGLDISSEGWLVAGVGALES
jgi:hypothetical protein